MMHFAGWTRLGIVLSVVWTLMVSGYAAYEFYWFPIPFNSEGSWGDLVKSKQYEIDHDFYFVEVKESPYTNEGGSSIDYSSGLNVGFFLFLLGTLAGGWSLGYAARWVLRGFRH
jgi:hypothetical protein